MGNRTIHIQGIKGFNFYGLLNLIATTVATCPSRSDKEVITLSEVSIFHKITIHLEQR